MIGLQADRGFIMTARLGRARPSSCSAQPKDRCAPARSGLEGDHPLPAGNRLAGLFHLVVKLGQPLPEVGLVGLELDGLLQPDQRVGQLPLALQHQPEVGVGDGQLRIQPQRFQVRSLGVDKPLECTRRALPRLWCRTAELGSRRTAS